MSVVSRMAGLSRSPAVTSSSPFVFSAAGRGRLHTLVHSDPRVFDELSEEWDALLGDSEQCVFFLRCRWNALWWQYYAPRGARLHFISCRADDGTLMGLAPLYWRQHRFCGFPYTRELLFIGMGIDLKTSEHLDIIARRGEERSVAEAIAEALRRDGGWDRLWLWQVPRESLVLRHLIREFEERGRTEVCDRAPFIDTSTDWATFKASFGRSMRRNVEYYPRRLFKNHADARFSRVRCVEELEPAIRALAQLHQQRWRAQGEPGAFDPVFEAFIRDVVRYAFATDRLLLWTFTIGGRIEAALLGFIDNGVVHYFQKGFNPEYAKEDLGTAMLALCVRDCFEDPDIKAFDFMGGGAAYKALWARVARENMVFEMQRDTLGAAMFSFKGRASAAAGTLYRRMTPEFLRTARREWLRKVRLARRPSNLAPLVTWWLNDSAGGVAAVVEALSGCF